MLLLKGAFFFEREEIRHSLVSRCTVFVMCDV